MPELKFPLSGDVTQFFKSIWQPWTTFMGQLGFININVGATSAPDIETHIVNNVASYGSQIGRIADALDVLVEKQLADKEQLTVDQIGALVEFRDQLREVRRAKDRARAATVS
jgi:hypothetical protein